MKIIWDVSNICNLSCKYCCAVCFEDKTYLSEYDYRRIIDNFGDFITEVDLMGGEPLSARNIRYVLNYLYIKSIKINMITNGQNVTLLKKCIFEDGISFNNIVVSIDGFIQTNDINRGEGSYEKAINFIREMINLKKATGKINQIGINIVLTKNNSNTLIEFIEMMLNEIQVDSVVVTPVKLEGEAKKHLDMKLPCDKELDILVKLSKYIYNNKIADKVNIDNSLPLVSEYLISESGLKLQIIPDECGALERTLYIDALGRLGECRYSKNRIDLKEQSILNSYSDFIEFQNNKSNIRMKKCNCIYKYDCNVCQLLTDDELEENKLCKYIKDVYRIDYDAKFILEKPYILYKKGDSFFLLSPSANIKEEYSLEGGEIIKCIAENALTVKEIQEIVSIEILDIYRFLVQCYSKSIVKRM